MTKKSKSRSVKAVLLLITVPIAVLLVRQALIFLFGENYRYSPGHFSAYDNAGYYEVNPENILSLLDRGEIDVLTPFYGNLDRDEPYYENIAWSQSDFLKLANAVSIRTWNESLDLESWHVLDFYLGGSCKDDPQGFHTFELVYYRDKGIRNFERQYETRMIHMLLWQGLVIWGGGRTYSVPLLLWWKGIDINKFKITAEDTLQISEQNGGLAIRQEVNNSCRILIWATNGGDLFPPYQSEKWHVEYDRTNYHMYVDPFTGKTKIKMLDLQ